MGNSVNTKMWVFITDFPQKCDSRNPFSDSLNFINLQLICWSFNPHMQAKLHLQAPVWGNYE